MSDGPMSPNQPVERDPVVSRALRAIPVPDHGPGFWAELEARLAEVDSGRASQPPDPAVAPTVAGGMPSGDDDSELPVAEPRHPESWRERRIRQRRLLLRVAALLLITAAGAALYLNRAGDRSREPADAPDVTTPVTPAPTAVAPAPTAVTPEPTIVTPAPTPGPPAATAAGTVQEFVRIIGRDRRGAFSLLTAESRQFLGSPAQLSAGLGPELRGWSAPGAVEQEAVMAARSPAAVRVTVVTYSGTLDIQGAPQPRTQAFAVLREAGEWRISLTATALFSSAGPAIEMLNPTVEPELECCGLGGLVAEGEPIRFRVGVPPERELVSVAFDGGETLSPALLDVSDAVVTARPPLEPGPHVVTIAILQPDGGVYARAVQFVVG